jgi:hypothetical protein
MIESLYTQERWNPEAALIFGTAARYLRDAVGGIQDDEDIDSSTVLSEADYSNSGFVENHSFISPRTGPCSILFEICQIFRSFRGHTLFEWGIMHPYVLVSP